VRCHYPLGDANRALHAPKHTEVVA